MFIWPELIFERNKVTTWQYYHTPSHLFTHLDWEADDDEKKVCGGEARQEGVSWRLEGGLPHHCQDDQDVATNSEAECKAGNNELY